MSDTTSEAAEVVKALSTLVVAAAVPVLSDRVELARADLFKEMRLHFGIIDQQAAILNEQRTTITTLIARLDQTQLALANAQIDLGIERTLGKLRDDQIRELQEAHNAIVGDAQEHLEQLRGQLDDRDRAMTEAEARIADLEKQVFLSEQDKAARIAAQTRSFWFNDGVRIFSSGTAPAPADRCSASWSSLGRHCGCKVCCFCKAPRGEA